jgi:hypothetical protein
VLRERARDARVKWVVGLALAATLLCSACGVTSGPTGFTFSAGIEGDVNVPRVLWLERVEMAVPTLADKETFETALTYNLARLLRQKQIFTSVKIHEGTAAPDDWIAHVRIERSVERGSVPLSTIVGSIFTLGFYAAVGRIQELEFEMVGSLELRDGRGQQLGAAETLHASTLTVYRKNLTNAFSFFMDERVRFVDQLLDETLVAAGAREP